MRELKVDVDARNVVVPPDRYNTTKVHILNLRIKEENLMVYEKKTEPYLDENGEAIITKDIEAVVKGTIQRCLKYSLSPMSVFYHIFRSIGDPKEVDGLRYLNDHFDPEECRSNKMLEFEQAVRYLGLPISISTIERTDMVSRDPIPCATPVGVVYAPLCTSLALLKEDVNYRFGFPRDGKELLCLEFIVPATKELIDYLPNMEQRYYAYHDAEESGWRL